MAEAKVPRVLILVCDSFGVGDAPDVVAYEDAGSDTLGNTASAVGGIEAPNLGALGLGMLTRIEGVEPRAEPGTAHGRLTERSAGKDTTTGHWEMAGIVLQRPFPLYPEGFPPQIMEPFEARVGRRALGNVPASGTEILAELGPEHLSTGAPIVYTSGDSVFQIATHTDVVPLEQLYEWCKIARSLLVGEHGVGRVIARPFTGEPGAFVRRPERRDLSVPPPGPTLLDRCVEHGVAVHAIGKIQDIFAQQGLTEAVYSDSNDDGIDLTIDHLRRPGPALVFSNLVKMSWIFPIACTATPCSTHRSNRVGPGGGTEKSRRSGRRTKAPGSPVNGRAITRPTPCSPTRSDRAILHHSYSCSSGTTSVCVAIWKTESPLV